MYTAINFLREFNTASVCLRLILAMVFGGAIGLERGRKGRAAGLRTYMLVCLGSALAMLLGQYELHMMDTFWASTVSKISGSTDIARFGAQVINGIGFLGAGTILVTGRQEVKGLTTAAGLWASACVGLAIGAGFYECVIFAYIGILLVIRFLPHIESIVIDRARNINIYTEFSSIDNLSDIITTLKNQDVHIYEVDIDRGRKDGTRFPSATFYIRLAPKQTHTKILAALSELETIHLIDEI